MASIRDFKFNSSSGSASHQAATVDYAENDILVFYVGKDTSSGGDFSLPSGYSEVSLPDNTSSSGTRGHCFVKKATASETMPTTTSASDEFVSYMVSVKNADVTGTALAAVIDSDSVTTAGSSRIKDGPALDTTGEDNCFLLYFAAIDQVHNAFFRGAESLERSDNGTVIGASLGQGYKQAGGVVTTPKIECDTGDNMVAIGLAIKDDGTAIIPGTKDPDISYEPIPTDISLPVTPASISGITVEDEGTNYDVDSVNNSNIEGLSATRRLEIFSSLSPNIGAIEYTFNSAIDCSTDRHIALSVRPNATADVNRTETIANLGMMAGVLSGSAWRTYVTGGSDMESIFKDGWRTLIVDATNTADVEDSSGSFTNTSVDGLNFFIRGTSGATSDTEWLCEYTPIHLKRTAYIGGTSSAPLTTERIGLIERNEYNLLTSLQGETQLFSQIPIQIGNNSDETYADLSSSVIELLKQKNAGTDRVAYLADNFLGVSYLLKSTNTVLHKNAVVVSTTDYHWEVNTSSSASATYNFNGLQVIGPGTTNINVIEHEGITFSGRDELVLGAGGSLKDCTIDNTAGTQSVTVASQADLNKIETTAFTNNTIAITVDVAGDITLTPQSKLTFIDNTVDINYTGTGTLTWVNANGTNASTETSATGAVTFVDPGTGILFSSVEDGSQVVVYETGTTTELHRTASSTGGQVDWDTTGDQGNVDYTIRKAGKVFIRATNVVVGTTKLALSGSASDEPIYTASSGLTHATDTSYNTGTSRFSLSKATTIRNWYSALVEFFISESDYNNAAFPLQAYGYGTIALLDDSEFTSDSHVDYLTRGAPVYMDASGAITSEWVSVESVGTAAGFTGEYEQVAGGTVTDAVSTGAFDQVIKVYGDASHGNFNYRDHLVLKYQPDGYRPAQADVYNLFGDVDLFARHYVVAMEPSLIDGLSTGDPSPTGLSITNHGASPVTWQSKDWSITITDTGSNSGATILQWLRYNLSLDATFQGEDPFDWPEMVLEDGDKYKTERGRVWGSAGATLKGIRVVDGSGDPHSSFSTMMADDGTLYTVPVVAGVSMAGVNAGWMELYNVTTATLIESVATTSGYSKSWTNGTDATAGDTLRMRWRGEGHLEIEDSIIATADSITASLKSEEEDTIYTTLLAQSSVGGGTGVTMTEFSFDSGNLQVDLNDGDDYWYAARMYIWHSYAMASADGIAYFWGAFEGISAGDLLVRDTVVDIRLDNLKAVNAVQGDSIIVRRESGGMPVVTPSTGGGGIGMYFTGVSFVASTSTSSALTGTQATQLANASAAAVKTTKLADRLVENSVLVEDGNGGFTQTFNGNTLTSVKDGNTHTVTAS